MQPDSYAGEGGPDGSFQGCVAMVQRAIATLDVAESPQQLLQGARSRVFGAGEYEERTVADVGSPRVGRTPDPDLRLRSRSRSRSKRLDVWFGGLERRVGGRVDEAGTHGKVAGQRSRRSEVRPERCGRGGLASIIIIITIKLAAERGGGGGTCSSCRRKGYTAKI